MVDGSVRFRRKGSRCRRGRDRGTGQAWYTPDRAVARGLRHPGTAEGLVRDAASDRTLTGEEFKVQVRQAVEAERTWYTPVLKGPAVARAKRPGRLALLGQLTGSVVTTELKVSAA